MADPPVTTESPALGGLPRSTIHDLRTPLTSIRGYAQLLMRGVRSEEQAQRAYLTIFREAERLAFMFDQLSKVADIQLGNAHPAAVRFDLGELAAAQVEQARARWPEHQVVLRSGCPAEVLADPRRIGELIGRLLDNAAGYSPPGSTIQVTTGGTAREACVSIADEGIGVPPDELEPIFDAFRRGSNAARAGAGASRGLGLGLFLARAEAEQAGGRLWAENRPEQGATFHLALPLAD